MKLAQNRCYHQYCNKHSADGTMQSEELIEHGSAGGGHIYHNCKKDKSHKPAYDGGYLFIIARHYDFTHFVCAQLSGYVCGHYAQNDKQHAYKQHAYFSFSSEHAEELPYLTSRRKTSSHYRAYEHESHV